MMRLNEPTAFVFEHFKNETAEETMISARMAEYDTLIREVLSFGGEFRLYPQW